MTGAEIMFAVRQRIADEDKLNISDGAMLNNINTAIRLLSQTLIARRAPEMMALEEVIDYSAVPVGFHSLIGKQPCYREGDVIRTYMGDTPYMMRYWRMKEAITDLTKTIFFAPDYTDILVTITCILCQNKDEMDTTFEQGLVSQISQMLPGYATNGTSSE